MPSVFEDKTPHEIQFTLQTEPELRNQLSIYSDALDDRVRNIIIRSYNDPKLHSHYGAMRASGIHLAKNSKAKNGAHLLVRFPNPYVFAFVETCMKYRYGPDWLQNKKVYKEPLVEPWMISKL